MQTVELEAVINDEGSLQIPAKYVDFYGQQVHLIMMLSKKIEPSISHKICDPMQFSNTINWPVDGLEYQHQMRAEWD